MNKHAVFQPQRKKYNYKIFDKPIFYLVKTNKMRFCNKLKKRNTNNLSNFFIIES